MPEPIRAHYMTTAELEEKAAAALQPRQTYTPSKEVAKVDPAIVAMFRKQGLAEVRASMSFDLDAGDEDEARMLEEMTLDEAGVSDLAKSFDEAEVVMREGEDMVGGL